jgi:hypothetical protein
MKKVLNVLAALIFTCAFASLAQAQATRTWVSGVGDDANPCSRTAPCKTFAGAISKTAGGGEIDALDPGGFGALTITKAITIDGGGGIVASVLVSGTNGFVISAGAGDVVTLNNLRFQGVAGGANTAGLNGIRFLSGKALNVLNCYIYGFSQNGIDVALNQSSTGNVFVTNTVIKNCAGDGISLANAQSATTLRATVERTSIVDGGQGLHVRSGFSATARNCDFSLNSGNGVWADALTAGAFAVARVWASQISLNGSNGALAGNGGNSGSSIVELAQNQVDGNSGSAALASVGGTIETFSNNSMRGNGTNGCTGVCTPVGPGN